MDSLRLQWRAVADRIDAMSLRERAMIFLAMLALLYIVAAQVVLKPLNADRERLDRQIKTKRDQVQSYERQLQQLVTGITDPNSPAGQQIVSLQQQLATLDDILAKSTGGLVSPREMARLVEQILSRHRVLQVVSLESLIATPIQEHAPPPGVAGNKPVADAGLYKHGMRIVVKGTYPQLIAYLRALEQLKWKVFWGKALLEAEEYPVSRLTLEIYTLSTHKGWIGL